MQLHLKANGQAEGGGLGRVVGAAPRPGGREGGIVERLFREFSITLAVAVVISLLVSLTLTPMLCARWLKAEQEQLQAYITQG